MTQLPLSLPERFVVLAQKIEHDQFAIPSGIAISALLDLFETGWIGVEPPYDRVILFQRPPHSSKALNRVLFHISNDEPLQVSAWFALICMN
jgi:hypothetical protein